MEKVNKKLWQILLGFEPNRELKEMIFAEMERDKLSLEEVSQRYCLPPMFILQTNDPEEKIEFEGESMTLSQFKTKYPFKKIIIIR